MHYEHNALEKPFPKMFLGGIQHLPPNGGNRIKNDFLFFFGLRH